MKIEDRIFASRDDDSQRELLINEYGNFILSCAKKVTGRYITKEDDEMSIALIAFNEAITKFDQSKGSFLSFASMIIRNRLIDHLRKESKGQNTIPFSSLSEQDEDGNEKEFEVEDTSRPVSDSALELEALRYEIERLGFSFFDLPKCTPKTKKTKRDCSLVIRYLLSNPLILANVKDKGIIPVKDILKQLKVNKKLLERHRKYFVIAAIVLSGDYPIISEYFREVKEGLL